MFIFSHQRNWKMCHKHTKSTYMYHYWEIRISFSRIFIMHVKKIISRVCKHCGLMALEKTQGGFLIYLSKNQIIKKAQKINIAAYKHDRKCTIKMFSIKSAWGKFSVFSDPVNAHSCFRLNLLRVWFLTQGTKGCVFWDILETFTSDYFGSSDLEGCLLTWAHVEGGRGDLIWSVEEKLERNRWEWENVVP